MHLKLLESEMMAKSYSQKYQIPTLHIQLLQSNHQTGATSKIAIFTDNGAIVMTSELCQTLIEKAIKQGAQTHVAD